MPRPPRVPADIGLSEPGAEDAEDRVNDLLAGVPAQAKMQVNRVLLGGKRESVGRYDVTAVPEDVEAWLARTFGPGTYRVEFFGPRTPESPSGYMKGKGRDITVAKDHPACEEWREEQRGSATRTPVGGGGGMPGGDGGDDLRAAGVAQILHAAAESMRFSREANTGGGSTEILTAMMGQQQAAADRTMQMFTALMSNMQQSTQAMLTMVTSLMANKTDPIELAAKLAELTHGGKGDKTDILAVIDKVLAIKDKLGDSGDAPRETTESVMIREGLPLLGRMVDHGLRSEAAARQLPTAPPPAPALAAPVGANPPPPAPPAAGDVAVNINDMITDQLKEEFSTWIAAAERGESPSRFGAKVWGRVELMEPTHKAVILQHLAETVDGKTVEESDADFALEPKAEKWLPQIAEHRDWFSAVFEELRICAGILDEDGEEDEEEGEDEENAKE